MILMNIIKTLPSENFGNFFQSLVVQLQLHFFNYHDTTIALLLFQGKTSLVLYVPVPRARCCTRRPPPVSRIAMQALRTRS